MKEPVWSDPNRLFFWKNKKRGQLEASLFSLYSFSPA